MRFDPNFFPSSQRGSYLSVCDEGTANSVARVAAVAQVALGYFKNIVAGKITKPRVAVFRATYIIYCGRPKCI